MKQKKVTVSNNLQKKYTYYLSAPTGKQFDKTFKPELTPKQMLTLGVFGGHYMEPEAWNEFPKDWISNTTLAETQKNPDLNFFKISASQPLSVWKEKDWIYPEDPYGWFQWYCRYYLGRRIPVEDTRQIKRWNAFTRHKAQVQKGCAQGDFSCRRKQRQALLHWAYDSRKI